MARQCGNRFAPCFPVVNALPVAHPGLLRAGAQQDKGRAVRLCASVFSQNTGDGLLTIGLGDSANDLSMLKRVDIPILIPHPDGSFEDIELLNLKKAPHPGSRGWNHAVLEVLDRLEG